MKVEKCWKSGLTQCVSNYYITITFNPIESCFNKIKTVLNGALRELVHTNLYLAGAEAVETITATNMTGFYEATSYLFI